jgi:hypothetical protein
MELLTTEEIYVEQLRTIINVESYALYNRYDMDRLDFLGLHETIR